MSFGDHVGSASSSEMPLPVFVFPSTLTFYVNDKTSHAQILTLYNPYDFPLVYKVLCTSPKKYSVVDPEGTLRPKCCIDIVIRHLSVHRSGVGQSDRFRIEIQEHGQKEPLGKKDISATLCLSKASSEQSLEAETGDFEGLSSSKGTISTDQPSRQYSFPHQHDHTPTDHRTLIGHQRAGPTSLIIVAGFLCVAALSMPTQGDKGSTLPMPPYLYLTVPQKLVAAYVLGIITMLLLRP